MNMIYAVGFYTNEKHGKSRATKQKARSLLGLCDSFELISLCPKLPKFLALIYIELNLIIKIFTRKPNVVISRGLVGALAYSLCKLKKIKFIREVHSDLTEEVELLKKPWIIKKVIKRLALVMTFLDSNADMVIFNHPHLMDVFSSKYKIRGKCFYTYNGVENFYNSSFFDKAKILNKYNLDSNKIIISFIGAASTWHGVDYVINLAIEFAKLNPNILVICAGGNVGNFEGAESVLNISPLDSEGCDEIISISTLCLLPVKHNRVSPGSPLKFYDYISQFKPVVVPENTLGYSDEFDLYGYGVKVDFTNTCEAAKKINKFVVSNVTESFSSNNLEQFTWESRMKVWVSEIHSLLIN